MKVTKDMKIRDIARKYPAVVPIMLSYGLHCIGCPVASAETLEEGAKAHGLSDDDIKRLVDELNKAIEEG